MGDRRDTKKETFFRALKTTNGQVCRRPNRLQCCQHACERRATGKNWRRRVTNKVFAKPPLGPPRVNDDRQNSGPAPLRVNMMLHRRWGTVETRKKETFFRAPRDYQRSRLQETEPTAVLPACTRASCYREELVPQGHEKFLQSPPWDPPKVNVHGQTSGPAPVHVNVMLHRRWGTVETRKKETFFRAPRDYQRSSLQETEPTAVLTACTRASCYREEFMLQGRIGAVGSRTKFLQSPPLGPPQSQC